MVTAIQPASVTFIVDVAGFDKVKYQLGLGKDQPSVDHDSVDVRAWQSRERRAGARQPTAIATHRIEGPRPASSGPRKTPTSTR